MTTGLTWKAGGKPAVEYFTSNPVGSGGGGGAAPKGKGKGGPPPMPKGGLAAPPPEGVVPKTAPAAGASAGGMAAVFSQLQGVGSDERGLKKVTDDMKTKNRDPNDRPAVVKAKEAPAPKAPAGGGRNVKGPRGPPIIELQ